MLVKVDAEATGPIRIKALMRECHLPWPSKVLEMLYDIHLLKGWNSYCVFHMKSAKIRKEKKYLRDKNGIQRVCSTLIVKQSTSIKRKFGPV